MSSLTLWDHGFALLAFVAVPYYSQRTHAQLQNALRKEGEPARVRAYRQTIAIWAGFALCLLSLWWLLQRDWAELGIRTADTVSLAVGGLAACLVIAMFVVPQRQLALAKEKMARIEPQLDSISLLMPRSALEKSWFRWVSVNAGVSEELIFRGYLLWYLSHYLDTAWAAILAILLFTLAHAYQGIKQLPGIALISAIAMGLFLYTGSLCIPILFHIGLDVLQGYYVAKILERQALAGKTDHAD